MAAETLKSIEDLVSEFYFAIHPQNAEDDVTGAPSIQVQRHGKGTAFVRGRFSGKSVTNPTLVYSDGHLDTVGICIFLALRRFRAAQPADPKLMVLDDVIISIDLGHARRLLQLLRTSFADHQILILTHSGLFAHWCRALLPNLTRLQITSWTLEGGPRLGDYASARERLERSILTGAAKEVGLDLMDLLDEWTAEARYEYSLSVPAKPGEEYTLSDIWNPLVKYITKLGKVMSDPLGGAVEAIRGLPDMSHIRNKIAAHESDFGREYPREVIVGVASDVLRAVDALYCAECRAFAAVIGDRNDPSVIECPRRHIRYLPAAPNAKSTA